MKRCGGLRKLFDANILRSRPSALTAPGSGDIATSSKGCPCICQVNINWNGFWPSWPKRMSPPAPKIKPLMAVVVSNQQREQRPCTSLAKPGRRTEQRRKALPPKWFLEVFCGSGQATADLGSLRVSPKLSPWEGIGEAVGRETHPTATGTVALPILPFSLPERGGPRGRGPRHAGARALPGSRKYVRLRLGVGLTVGL